MIQNYEIPKKYYITAQHYTVDNNILFLKSSYDSMPLSSDNCYNDYSGGIISLLYNKGDDIILYSSHGPL